MSCIIKKIHGNPRKYFRVCEVLVAAHILLKSYPFLLVLNSPAGAVPFLGWPARILLPGQSDCSRMQHVPQFYQHETFSGTDTDVEEKFYLPRYSMLSGQCKLGVALWAPSFRSENKLLHKGKQRWERHRENERGRVIEFCGSSHPKRGFMTFGHCIVWVNELTFFLLILV